MFFPCFHHLFLFTEHAFPGTRCVDQNLIKILWEIRNKLSRLFTTIALGMILSVSRQNDEQSHDTPRSESIYEK